jgi:hypothetical protein
MHPLLAKRIEIPWTQIGEGTGVVLRPVKSFVGYWRWPMAIAMVLCSLVPVSLLYLIYAIDYRSSWWAFKHLPRPFLTVAFHSSIQLGFILPILTAVVAIWFGAGRSCTAARFAWAVLALVILHLFWLSWGILGFYLANQHFVMF